LEFVENNLKKMCGSGWEKIVMGTLGINAEGD
jgi:hypothetical protein